MDFGSFGPVGRSATEVALPPLGHGLLIDPVAASQSPQALLTMLYRSTDRLCRRGAAVKNLAHSASLHAGKQCTIKVWDQTPRSVPRPSGYCRCPVETGCTSTTLFAALDMLEGKVIGRCIQRHRHQEFIRFLNTIEAEISAGKIIHVILDNYGPHKHPKTRAWLARHPRFVFHYTPTSASWLNAVEGFFAKLTKRRLKRGVFCSIIDLQAAIDRFLRETNDDPKPFVWTVSIR